MYKRIRLLYRYLLKTNLYYLVICLLVCIFIYLLVDLFDRLDNFLNKSAPFSWIIKYFLWKIPVIISQISPIVFFLTCVVQFTIMGKNREWEALEGGGISKGYIYRFILVYSIIFATIQLFFSQYIGTIGMQKTDIIWDSLGKNKIINKNIKQKVWSRKKNYIVYISELDIRDGKGKDIEIYEMGENFLNIKKAIFAKQVKIYKNRLNLIDVLISFPEEFKIEKKPHYFIKEKNMDIILDITSSNKIEDVPLWKLRSIVQELKRTGSNVEDIVTLWYSKIAYSFSIVILSILSVYISRKSINLPFNIAISLLMVFLFYAIFVVGTMLGKHGILPPFIGAFLVHLLFVLLFLGSSVFLNGDTRSLEP